MPVDNNYGEMGQGIDRITEILKQQSTPIQSSPLQPQASQLPVNILNALASASYDYGNGGSNFVGNVHKYQSDQQNQELEQNEGILKTYQMKLRMGDAQTKALDDKISMFTGNDPEGKALFLQALHEDPEPIDPTNSYQVMTKLAGIKKRTGYESPELSMQKQKDQLDIDYKHSQIGANNALINQRNQKTEAAPVGKPLPLSGSNVVLNNRENLDKAKKALALIEGNSIVSNSGNITKGDKAATGVKGNLPDAILQRVDKGGVATRAAIADIGSMVIHERSGAAVSASESPRLVPFIPKSDDDPEVVKTKLQRFVNEYQAIVDENEDFYRDSGYNVPENRDRFSVLGKEAENDPRIQKARDAGYSDDEIQQYLGGQ